MCGCFGMLACDVILIYDNNLCQIDLIIVGLFYKGYLLTRNGC